MVRSISMLTSYKVGIFPLLISAMLMTRCCPMVLQRQVFNLRNPLNDRSSEHDIILESYAKISSRLEIPQTNYIEQCNTVPTITELQIRPPLKMTRNSSCARQPLSRLNSSGFTTLTSV